MSNSNISLAPKAISFPKEFVALSKDTREDNANIACMNQTFIKSNSSSPSQKVTFTKHSASFHKYIR